MFKVPSIQGFRQRLVKTNKLFPFVVKADEPLAGKGVVIVNSLKEFDEALDRIRELRAKQKVV